MALNNKSLLQSEELYNYMLETSVCPREPTPLKELREASANKSLSIPLACPLTGQFLSMLLKLVNAKMIIEIGVSTGYYTLLTALTIPQDGEVLAIDPDQNSFDIGLPIIEKAGVEHKINFVDSDALPILNQFAKDRLNLGSFDFALINIDTENYGNYYEKLVKLVKVGGLICFNNTLQEGNVAKEEQNVQENERLARKNCIEFTKAISQNPQVDIWHCPIGNGLLICKRLY